MSIKKCKKCGDWDRIPAAEYQNKHYGKGTRVMNPVKKEPGKERCTVCGELQ